MEETNRKILALLAGDGRLSYTELARQTGLSVSAVQQRVRRLEERGVIRGYSALIDPQEAGLPLTAFVSIKPFDPAAADDAPERLAHLNAIEACHSVAGEENYILKVRVASPVALEELLQEIRAAASVSTRTTIVLSTPFEGSASTPERQLAARVPAPAGTRSPRLTKLNFPERAWDDQARRRHHRDGACVQGCRYRQVRP